MRPRGNCPECHLRDVTHVVEQTDVAPQRLCRSCALAYEHPARMIPIEA